MKYIVLSPVGSHKYWCLDRFIKSVKALEPAPSEIVICIDLDYPLEKEYDGVIVKYSPEFMEGRGELSRISSAREILRKYFIYHPDYEYALWIDSDILVPPETAAVLKKVLDDENLTLVVNKYQGRTAGMDIVAKWCGSGVMFMHRMACTMSRFWVGNIYDKDGVEKHLSEDFVFFSIFDQGKHMLKKWTGKGGRTCREFVVVKHLLVRDNGYETSN